MPGIPRFAVVCPKRETVAGVENPLSYKFRDVNFSHVVRSGNKAAHTLAQFARGVSDQNAWVEETPSCIEQLVPQDVLFCLSMN